MVRSTPGNEVEITNEYQALLTAIVNNSDDAIISKDLNGIIMTWNAGAEKLFGYTAVEIIGQPVAVLIPQSLPDEEPAILARIRQGESIDHYETVRKRKDGSLVSISLAVSPIRNKEGVIIGASKIARDITPSKFAQTELNRNKELLEQAEELAGIGSWSMDLKTNKSYWSKQMFRLFGLEPATQPPSIEEYILRVHPADRNYVTRAIKDASEGLIPVTKIYRTNPELLPLRYLLPMGKIKKDGNDEFISFSGTLMDVTERQQNNEKLEKSERRFRALVEHNDSIITLMDRTLRPIFRTGSAELVTGYTDDDRKTMTDIDEIHPDDMDAFKKTMLTVKTNPGLSVQLTLRIKHKQGHYIWLETTYTNMFHDPDIAAIIVNSRDVTDRERSLEALKESESRYRLLFDANPFPALVIDLESFHYLAVNSAAITHYGYSQTEFLSMTTEDIRPVEEVERYKKWVSNENRPREGYIGAWKHKKKDGSIIDVELVGHKITYGDKPALLILVRDVTEKLKADREINKINQELRTLSAHLQSIREEERIQIARDIHDELGQQLTGLKMDVYALNKKLPDPDPAVKQKITDITELIDEAVRSVRKIAANLRPSILDDLGLVSALEWQSTEVENRFGIKVNFIADHTELNLSTSVSTNLFRIYQEALTNAVRHANARLINSKLTVSNNSIILEIADDGKGMDLTKDKTGSFGILGIKERVFVMGGNYEFKSEPGKGTSLAITIPYKL